MMRAKMIVQSVTPYGDSEYSRGEILAMNPVCGSKPYGPNGESEDNTYARYTPFGALTLGVTNPELLGKIKAGNTFYVDFTPVPAS